MISWHKPGQKVVVVEDHRGWRFKAALFLGPGPDDVCSIAGVECINGKIFFELVEWPGDARYQADCFRPVCPQIVDQLLKLDTPVPSDERVKECV